VSAFREIERKAGMRRGLVETADGAFLHVEVHGRGPAVMLVHGWCMSGRYWRRQIETLAQDMTLVVPDLRAHGLSSKTLDGLTLAAYAQDLEAIAQALGLERMVLAGWSLAGPLVLEYWRRYAQRVAGLALVEMTPAPLSPAEWNTHKLKGYNLEGLAQGMAALAADREKFISAFVDAMFFSGQCSPAERRWMLAESLNTPAPQAAAVYTDYMMRDFNELIPAIDAPALAVYGDSPHMCFGPKVGRHLAETMPDCRLSVCQQSGHMPFYEEPEVFNQALVQLVRRAGL